VLRLSSSQFDPLGDVRCAKMACSPNHNGYETWYLSSIVSRRRHARRAVIALLGGSAISWPVSLNAQQQISKTARIGV
jgi:hypothetical protein